MPNVETPSGGSAVSRADIQNIKLPLTRRRTMTQIGQKVAKIIKIVSRGYEELVPRYELHTIQ